jgi:peptidoglycan/LPS O-acetylase OafA/YrhL
MHRWQGKSPWRCAPSNVMSVAIDRDTATGDEAGTPPGDRKFRPDVQGMRAIAICLVLVYHAGVPGFSGGYVGIDVFFVISGFVITGLLLREREGTGHTSLRSFYGRRSRRIIPAATLVIIVTVLVTYHSLGPLVGHETAVDGQWAALFLANFHFEAIHTNYLAAQAPPSPLLNYWSLGVEEQFYIVYPTLFLLIGWWARKGSFRTRLTIVLVAVIVASYTFSVVYTSVNSQGAYYSLLTRSWELALGGLIAVHGRRLQRIPQAWAALGSWLGLAAIMVSSVTLTGSSLYPGALVAIPTLGTGLVVAAGAAQPKWGVERLLRHRTFQFVAAISFSLFLWHWPILEIAAQRRGVTSLPVWDNIGLLLVAGVLATLTYYFFENPIRHSRFLARRRWTSLILGLCLIAATLAVTTYVQHEPYVNLGILTNVTSGSVCKSPPQSAVSKLTSTYTSGHAHPASDSDLRQVVLVGDSTACTMLPGLQAVGPSYGLRFEDGSVIGCGVVSGTIAPNYIFGTVNVSAYTVKCQGEANLVESQTIGRYRPTLVVWGSTDERNSIVVDTPTGSKVIDSGSPEWRSVMLQRMDNRVDKFVASGARVILLLEPPQVHSGTPALNSTDLAYEHMNDLLKEVAARHPRHVAVVNLEARVCPSGPPCQFVVDGFGANPKKTVVQNIFDAIRPDQIHYSAASSLWVAKWLVPRIAAAGKKLS